MKETELTQGLPTKEKIGKGIALAVALFTVVAITLLSFTVSKKTPHLVKSANWLYLVFALFAWATYLSFDGLKIFFLAKAMGARVRWRKCVEVVAVGIFLAAITPFQFTGFPVQVYMLKREGLSVGTATLVMAGRGVISAIPILIFLVPAIKLSQIPFSSFYKAFYVYVIGIGGLLLIVFLISFIKPHFLTKLVPKKFKKLRNLTHNEAQKLDEASKILKKPSSIPSLLFSLLSSFGTWFAFLLILPLLLYSLGINVSLPKAISLTLVLQFAILWSPSPGAVGIAEALGSWILLKVCPKELIGVLIILWRIFTFYITAIAGGIMLSILSLSIGKGRSKRNSP